MTFNELAIGDWFTDGSGMYVENCIFIKTGEEEAYPLNWGSSACLVPDVFSGEYEVKFCSHFSTSFEEIDGEEKCPFDYKSNNYELHHYFNEIPVGSIYKGKGQTYYKKISDITSIAFWTPNFKTMGKIFERKAEEIDTHYGTYHLCNSGTFNFPEEQLSIPYKTP